MDRPFCMYQKELHDEPVCTERMNNRECAYPGHWCLVKEVDSENIDWREQGYQPRRE